MANRILHFLVLVGAIALGTILRFWHLDLKPLWLDEVITALFSLGRNYNDIPLEEVFSLERLDQIFSFNPASCPQIAHNLATQSTHPPLFFCLMHKWVETHLVGIVAQGLSWWMRSLPALFGVSAIAAVYYLNRVAFSPAAGLMGAAMMAVSPFTVYLSQESRHYTLPMLLITLALLGLIQIQQDLFSRQQLRVSVWLGWAIVNSIGFYVHYFFVLAFIAQVVTLFGLMYWQRHILPRKSWFAANLAVVGVIASFTPWLPILLGHFNSSETSWLPQPQHIIPLYQTLVSWVLMIIALPVENQHLLIAVPSGLLMVAFAAWVVWHTSRGLGQLWHTPENQLSILTLGSFTLCVLLEFFAITYLLGKDITFVPRYHFVYYPSLVALIAASLVKNDPPLLLLKEGLKAVGQSFYLLFFTFSFLSCVLVVSNFVFQKPYNPQLVAQNMNQESVPLMVVVGYQDYQDVALGLSFALALKNIRSDTELAFFKRSLGYEYIWEKLSQLPPLAKSQHNLWVVAPELKQQDYPPYLTLSSQTTCTIDSSQHYRIGIPYQLYQCNI